MNVWLVFFNMIAMVFPPCSRVVMPLTLEEVRIIINTTLFSYFNKYLLTINTYVHTHTVPGGTTLLCSGGK